MNHKLKNRTLLHGDIVNDVSIAEFSDALAEQSMHRMVNAMNYGDEMLRLYQSHRDNKHITNILQMLEEMEKVYRNWNEAEYNAKRLGPHPR